MSTRPSSVATHTRSELRRKESPSTLVGAGRGKGRRPVRPSLAQFASRPESGGISKNAPRRKAYRSTTFHPAIAIDVAMHTGGTGADDELWVSVMASLLQVRRELRQRRDVLAIVL